jgi:lysophospholipase L1-like esterase
MGKSKNDEKNIFVFGDSCAQGFWDSHGGWATRLKRYFDNLMVSAPNFPDHGFYYMVYPLGITGDTTKSILERFEFETEKRMAWPVTEEIFVFAIGKNDTAFLDIAESRRNLKEIIKRTRRFSKNIIFLELGPVNEKITQPVPWDEKCFYNNQKISDYNAMLKEVAAEEGVDVIGLFKEWKSMDYLKFLADGVHPNDAGHEFIFNKVKDFLLKKFF